MDQTNDSKDISLDEVLGALAAWEEAQLFQGYSLARIAVDEAQKTIDDLRHRLVGSEAESAAAVRELQARNGELARENSRLKRLVPTFSSEEDLLGGRTQRLSFTVHVTEEQLTQANHGALVDYLVSSFREGVVKTLGEA